MSYELVEAVLREFQTRAWGYQSPSSQSVLPFEDQQITEEVWKDTMELIRKDEGIIVSLGDIWGFTLYMIIVRYYDDTGYQSPRPTTVYVIKKGDTLSRTVNGFTILSGKCKNSDGLHGCFCISS